ncbi:MAG: thioredoxin family protein [Bacteroidetes bacterium B1(2017)]|nr:MAG: thioredoxin family protein [Bacteroidetes bacterium B1(2017)]
MRNSKSGLLKLISFVFFVLLFSCSNLKAQHNDTLLYHPFDNAKEAIGLAAKKAKQENKMVLLQIGGNWCKWCIEFNRFCKANPTIDSLLKADYVVYHLNYSKENKNEEILTSLQYPNRFGFPVFVILDGNGSRVHTQNSSYLEEGKSYSEEKIIDFLKGWNYKALHP